MCYSIPGRVVKVENKQIVLDYFGEKKVAINELGNIREGDYVFAQGGFVIEKVNAIEAEEILAGWKERFAELKAIDRKLSWSIVDGADFQVDSLSTYLSTDSESELKHICDIANRIRYKHLGNSCCVHGIIEFSNYCRNNCYYCGIRCDNMTLKRYRMSISEIVACAEYAVNNLGFRALVLQSGEDMYYTDDMLAEIISRIRDVCNTLIIVSVGSRSEECYKEMYGAGARGALIRFETSNLELYKKYHIGPKADWNHRFGLIKSAKDMGYLVATGSIIGLPGQTITDVLNDILLTKELGAEMYSFGPFIPHPNTPLAGNTSPNINLVLKTIAVSRMVSPNAKILVTTALETLDPEGLRKGLMAGANSFMINVTPEKYRRLYDIYPRAHKNIEAKIKDTIEILQSLGRAPSDFGI
ncbi:MAG: [FeFe] hydrogenase H-cluster radical SAM maturase HydE [Candidatus Micrarchaeia archaeon]